MTNTTNYDLNLIEEHDLLDFAPFNENANIIDTELKNLADAVDDIPTMETAISNNSSDITDLQTRTGSIETDISTINSKVTALENTDVSHQQQINANASAINTLRGRTTALETKEGDILKIEGQNVTTNPTIIKKLTVIGKPTLDQNDNINIKIFGSYLPTEFSDYFVNASIYSKSNQNTYMPYIFNRTYIDPSGALTIQFSKIDEGDVALPEPIFLASDLQCYAEIIFM